MRVLIWNTNFLRDGGGSQKITYYLSRGLQERGCAVTIACNTAASADGTTVFGNLPSGVTLYQDSFVNPWDSSTGALSFLSYLLTYLRAALRFIVFARRERFCLIHLNYVSWDIWLLGVCKWLLRLPIVISFLGGETDLAPQTKLTRIKIKLALRLADKTTAVSQHFLAELERDYGYADALHIPFLYDASRSLHSDVPLPPGYLEDQYVFCGRVAPEKRVSFLIEAFKEAVARGCTRMLYIVGTGPKLPGCRELVGRLALEDRIVFLGQHAFQTTQRIISRSRCLILVSRTESNPQVVLEAMSLGKPVICSSIPGVQRIVQHERTGLLFEPHRKDELVEALLRVSADRKYVEKLGNAAAALFRSLHADQDYTERMTTVYAEVSADAPQRCMPNF